MTCRCVNVSMGSYANQEALSPPWGGVVGIDRCIADEIRALWAAGIRTIESCCGHNQAHGYVAVAPESEPQMEVMGYRRDPATPHVFELNVEGNAG